MQPQAAPTPLSETRYLRANNMIYKFKIRCNSGHRREFFRQELEKIIRTVLGNLSSLQPFSSVHFNVFPYKTRRRPKAEVICRSRCERNFQVFPFDLIVCLKEKKSRAEADPSLTARSRERRNLSGFIKQKEKLERSSPVWKRCRSDSPLEGAILQALAKDLEEESRVKIISRHYGKASSGDEAKQRASDLDKESGSRPQGEIQAETQQSTSEEEESDEEGEDAQPGSETPAKPGLLSRLASYIFPFSMLAKEP